MPDLADILAACSNALPDEATLIIAAEEATALAHERDHGLGDPKACIDAYLHARGCGRDIPEFALAGVVAYLRTGKLAKATRWHQNSIMAAAACAVREREYEISGRWPLNISRRDVAQKMLVLLAQCDDYSDDCAHAESLDRVVQWLRRHEAIASPHPDWLARFEYQLDP